MICFHVQVTIRVGIVATFDAPSFDAWKKQFRDELKKELLAEIYKELNLEEKRSKEENVERPKKIRTKQIMAQTEPVHSNETVIISIKPILKIASHALKYANRRIPQSKWVEVIGLLAGKLDPSGTILTVEDAFPIGHGDAIYAEIKDYKNYVRVFNAVKKRSLFICGWYHSHPTYGLFISQEDFGTQVRYQQMWDKSIALVIDPSEIDGSRWGFGIFRGDLRARRWFSIPYALKEPIDSRVLPSLLNFIWPIIDGKTSYFAFEEGSKSAPGSGTNARPKSTQQQGSEQKAKRRPKPHSS